MTFYELKQEFWLYNGFQSNFGWIKCTALGNQIQQNIILLHIFVHFVHQLSSLISLGENINSKQSNDLDIVGGLL